MSPLSCKARHAAVVLLTLSLPGLAQTVTWTGPDTGPWATGGNWSPAGVPGVNSDVVIDGETETARTVNVSGASVVNSVAVSTGDILRISGNSYLQTGAAGYTVDGTLDLAGGGDSRLYVPVADTALKGGGTVRMTTGTRLYGGGSLTSQAAIAGAGGIGWNELRVVNTAQGRISANVSGQTLGVDPRNAGVDAGLVNAGRMEATHGGILLLSGYGGGWYDNTGGTLRAADGSQVSFVESADVRGGTLASEGSGLFSVTGGDSAYWTDVTHSGATRVNNNAWLRCGGTITNSGAITLFSTGNGTRFHLYSPVTLTGPGRLILSNSDQAIIAGPHLLTIADGQTVEGRGNAGNNDTPILLDTGCVMQASVAGQTLGVDPGNRDSEGLPGFVNKGRLQAVDGGFLLLSGYGNGWFDNTAGTIRAAAGSQVTLVNSVDIRGGSLVSEETGQFSVAGSDHAYWTDVTHDGTTVVNNNAWLRCGGTITNNGSIRVVSTGNGTRFQLNGPVTLTGPGRLILSNHDNAIIGGPHLLTIAGTQMVEGRGVFGNNETPVLLEAGSVVQANVAGAALGVDPRNRDGEGLPGFVNKGMLQAVDQGTLNLSGYGGGWFDNAAGTIRAAAGSQVVLYTDTDIRGGTLVSEGTGRFIVAGGDSAYWTGVTHNGTTSVSNNAWLRCGGTITNNGDITLSAAGNGTRFQVESPVTLTGPGRLTLNNTPNAIVAGGQPLTVAGGQMIQGQGNIGYNETPVTLQPGCVIQANVEGAALGVDPRNRDADNLPGLLNKGVLQAVSKGVLNLSGYGGGWFDNAAGTIRAAEDSQVVLYTNTDIRGGTLVSEGTGRFIVAGGDSAYWTDVTHNGTTSVSNNAWLRCGGTITNNGDISLAAAANGTRFQLYGPVTLTGPGRVILGNSDNAIIAGVQELTVAGGQTLEGRGNIANNESVVTVQPGCVIQANVANANLYLDPRNRNADNLPGLVNKGTLQAVSGGKLGLSGYGGGWFENTGGLMRAAEGSEVAFYEGADIRGGTLTCEGTGQMRINTSDSVYWTDLTHSGNTRVDNNAWLRCAGAIKNQGTITLNSTANGTRFQLQANTVLSGGGKLVMAGDTRNNALVGGGFLLTNDQHTIEGQGNIGNNESAFYNTAGGIVSANVAGRDLGIDPGGTKLVTNRGILRAENGGNLLLSGYGNGVFDNANGIIEALDGSRVYFVSGAAISGGVFRTAGTGAVVLPVSQAMAFTSNTTNTGLFIAENNTAMYLNSRLTNTGIMRVNAGGNLSGFVLQDNTVLGGGGVIELKGANARISGAAVLIVENQTIRGSGNIGRNESSISVSEHGLVVADVPGETLYFDPTPLFGFTNEGTLRAENGGTLSVSAFGGGEVYIGSTGRVEALEGGRVQFDNTAVLINRNGSTLTGGKWLVKGRTAPTSLQLPGGNITVNAANIELDGAQAQFPQAAGITTNNGTLTLNASASLSPAGAFTNGGTLDIGAGCAVTAGGNVTLGTASVLTCHIGGPASYGSLSSATQTMLGGGLTLVFDPGFTPVVGDQWPILSGSPSGQFPQVAVRGLPSSLSVAIEVTPATVLAKIVARDGINFTDWAAQYGFASPADAAPGADPDHDGLANLLEFALGTHPLRSESDAAPQPVIVTTGGQSYAGLTFWQPAGNSFRLGISYLPESSSGGSTWTASGIITHNTVPADATGRERITVRMTTPLSTRQLMRLRVTQP